jgi:hypothetical protein
MGNGSGCPDEVARLALGFRFIHWASSRNLKGRSNGSGVDRVVDASVASPPAGLVAEGARFARR